MFFLAWDRVIYNFCTPISDNVLLNLKLHLSFSWVWNHCLFTLCLLFSLFLTPLYYLSWYHAVKILDLQINCRTYNNFLMMLHPLYPSGSIVVLSQISQWPITHVTALSTLIYWAHITSKLEPMALQGSFLEVNSSWGKWQYIHTIYKTLVGWSKYTLKHSSQSSTISALFQIYL